MKDRQVIKRVRSDMSDYVLHCTRERSESINPRYRRASAYSVLKAILKEGFFRAGFAERVTRSWNLNPTVRGPFPAVCFTEQPLQFFIKSISANRRYTSFAIAVRKDNLFYYGGPPVIY